MGTVRHVLEVDDLGPDGLEAVLGLAGRDPAALPRTLAGRGVALVFEKPSARTRNSSELATVALGGHPVYIQGAEVGIDTRESGRGRGPHAGLLPPGGVRPGDGPPHARAHARTPSTPAASPCRW